jgi:hypothetical protein
MPTLDTLTILYSTTSDEGRTWDLHPPVVIPVTYPAPLDAARDLVASLSSPTLRVLSARLDDNLGVTELVDTPPPVNTAPWDPDGTPF